MTRLNTVQSGKVGGMGIEVYGNVGIVMQCKKNLQNRYENKSKTSRLPECYNTGSDILPIILTDTDTLILPSCEHM